MARRSMIGLSADSENYFFVSLEGGGGGGRCLRTEVTQNLTPSEVGEHTPYILYTI